MGIVIAFPADRCSVGSGLIEPSDDVGRRRTERLGNCRRVRDPSVLRAKAGNLSEAGLLLDVLGLHDLVHSVADLLKSGLGCCA